jgi:alkyl sulfatase BDS1-like metallo-beta-lactamase superfamily hydrolase
MVLIVIGLLVVASVVVLFTSDSAQQEAKLRAGEALGEVALARVAAATAASGGSQHERSADLIKVPIEVKKLNDFVFQARGVGNTHLIATSEGNVIFDTGLVLQAAKQRRVLDEAVPEAPITHVILSHSHQDHVGGTTFWTEDGTEIVAHYEFPEEQRYLKELTPYLHDRNRTLFPWLPEKVPSLGPLDYGNIEPTILVRDGEPFAFELGGVRFEVLPTPGAEGADNVCLWLPDHKILFSGDFFGPLFPQFPNVFTMRGEKVRKPIEYIESLETLIALEPEMIVPSHDAPIAGKEQIRADMERMRDAVRYVHDATIAGMNAGKTVHELMAEIVLPPELALRQVHGKVSWAVRSIWEYYATWFHFDTTTELYPVPDREVFSDLAELAGADALVKRARSYLKEEREVHALHLMDVVLEAEPSHRGGLQVRKEALESLLKQAEGGVRNAYEMDFLKSRIRATEQAMGPAGGPA